MGKMKEWNFTFDDGRGDWGWNAVYAATKASAIKKAEKKLAGFNSNYVLDKDSVNCDYNTYRMLMLNFD